MRSLSTSLMRLRSLTGTELNSATRQVTQDAVMYLLQTQPFYGRVLSQLTLHIAAQRRPLGLVPTADAWELVVSPAALARAGWTGAEWLAMLRHTVLHLVWQHPQRYAAALQSRQQAPLVRWATDAAVNDYLTDLPAGAITSRTLQRITGQVMPPRQASNVYWQRLRDWQATVQTGAHPHPQAGENPGTGDVTAQNGTPLATGDQLDGHQGWRDANQGNVARREQWRQGVLQTTANALTAKQRGTLPGAIRATLDVRLVSQPLDWRGLLQRALGQVPAGRQPAYGRFNRRQPRRMDLPGQVVATWERILIFVDESGSMGNREIAYLLGQLERLLAIYPVPIRIYPFDTQVHDQRAVNLTGRLPRHLLRTGGGGTRFQAVFDALPRLTQGQSTLVVILTDGFGEARIQTVVPAEVLWLLTSSLDSFSVVHAPGQVLSLIDDPQWRAIKEAPS